MYTLDKSGRTTGNGEIDALWGANADNGTRIRIQNRSRVDMEVVVTKTDGTGIVVIVLPANSDDLRGKFTDESWVDISAAVGVRSHVPGAEFTALRLV